MRPIAEQRFAKSFESLPAVFVFLEEALGRITGNAEHHQRFVLAVEEFFTNMVKYHPEGQNPITISVALHDSALHVVLADTGVEPYDVTLAPEPDLDAPLDDRKVGGLGIFLSKALLDEITYDHRDRTSFVTLKKHLEPNDVLHPKKRPR